MERLGLEFFGELLQPLTFRAAHWNPLADVCTIKCRATTG